ncbi:MULTISPECIES: penicillin-binding transpeptidase domain-containing protein [unclassified Niallia]|uniref:penicillin-binding protein n=1 Tax=Niallia TaxID=2837506 RepID=UPI001EDA47EE|nr:MULTISPECIES: penicillin-binding transpeptidase domain-containing protein [unclassified Niallia]MCM3029084.1 penicillin-binding transpeptidase domain-containing protein [Niallia sp. MER 6]MDL0435029.1 penicillin-binding transpeptidase domain-containing protein [Niallia sp. SS-2023]UPO88834.1 PASTA domain-containing protein [Niallia sp. Man26]
MIRKQQNINLGAAILFLFFCLLFFILIVRFAVIQSTGKVSGEVLAKEAEKKYSSSMVLEASRGTIYDRNKDVIAEDASSYKLVAVTDSSLSKNDTENPIHVADPEKTAKELAKYIDMEESEIYRILTKEGAKQVEFGSAGKNLSYETKKKIEDLKLPGVLIVEGKKRFYPNGTFASHVIGYVEEKEDEATGKYTATGKLGIEESLNNLLTGKDGYLNYKRDIWGYILPDSEEDITPAQNGDDVYLTLDKKIQSFLEDTMSKVQEKYNPKKMIAIVANPKTGEILAMSQRPSFDPETLEGINATWHNEAIETSYEPGSTMKIFTLAAAIEEGKFDANAKYQSGSYKVTKNSQTIHDHNGSGWGSITYLEGVQRSSNVAFAKIAKEQLGFEKLREYITNFGLDQKTGIDLPHEANSSIAFTWPVEKITTAYGQGTALTPIQQIQAVTAIANDGKMVKPHVIDKIVDPNTNKVVKQVKTEVVGTPISAATAKEVRDILETVVTDPKGTGYKKYNVDGYSVAGKTGTASIPKAGGGYLTGSSNYVFSFLGMAPKDDPELVMYVAVQQPELKETQTGSDPVAEIFTSVMKSSLQYMEIQPTADSSLQTVDVPDLAGMSTSVAEKELKKSGLELVVTGEGSTITDQLPAAGESYLEGEKIVVKTDGKGTVPDMIGWSLRDILKVTDLQSLKLKTNGNGYATKQSIKAGKTVKENDTLTIQLKKPE